MVQSVLKEIPVLEKDIKPNATYGEIRNVPAGELLEFEKNRGAKYWEYRRRWSEYPKKSYVSDFPLNLDIETTNVCNLDCVMCPRTIQIARKTYTAIGYMHFDLYRSLLDQGVGRGLAAIKLNYLGEPLLHPDVVKQVKYAKDVGVMDVMFNTNATLLTEEKSHALLEAGLDNIFFSVDSAYRDKYNAIRIGADFDAVVKNIVRFCEIKKKGNYKNVQTRVSMTVMDNDYAEVEAYTKFWLQYVDVVGFGIYHDIDGIESPYNPNFSCSQPFQRLFVMWDGICTPCCTDSKREYIVGDVKTSSVRDIWHGSYLSQLREQMVTGRYKEVNICSRCYVPYTSLDGTLVSFDNVEKEVKEAATKQKLFFHDSKDLELPERAIQRRKTSAHI